mmetsp:Transcript_13859/g.37666  ORF Transcript_13859/g.37666 Transcript_13859/m.37666 type:complete len:249 (-) Transcript_13859:115-861(-)
MGGRVASSLFAQSTESWHVASYVLRPHVHAAARDCSDQWQRARGAVGTGHVRREGLIIIRQLCARRLQELRQLGVDPRQLLGCVCAQLPSRIEALDAQLPQERLVASPGVRLRARELSLPLRAVRNLALASRGMLIQRGKLVAHVLNEQPRPAHPVEVSLAVRVHDGAPLRRRGVCVGTKQRLGLSRGRLRNRLVDVPSGKVGHRLAVLFDERASGIVGHVDGERLANLRVDAQEKSRVALGHYSARQ